MVLEVSEDDFICIFGDDGSVPCCIGHISTCHMCFSGRGYGRRKVTIYESNDGSHRN